VSVAKRRVTVRPRDPVPSHTARVVHAALLTAVVLWTGAYFALRVLTREPQPPSPGLRSALQGVFFVVVALVTFLGVRGRKRLRAPRLQADPEAFWRQNLPKLLLSWGAAEMGAIVGVVFAWLTGVAFMAVFLPALAVLMLLLTRPGALRSN
jgi:hypothetical protein